MNTKICFSLEEAAELLSIGSSHLKKFTNSGELKTFKLGNRRLVRRDTIEEFIKRIEENGYAETPQEVCNEH